MNSLFRSQCFVLLSAEPRGKKETCGILKFKGMPSRYGNERIVTAVAGGVVKFAGIAYDSPRRIRWGCHVIVEGDDGVCIIYEHLASKSVKEGDTICEGDDIGIATLNNTIALEFRRNNRRVDGYAVLGLDPAQKVFKPSEEESEMLLAQSCGISESLRMYINKHPDAHMMWDGIRKRFEPKE